MSLPGSRCSPIGLDIGDRWVKAVQLRRSSAAKPWTLAARARFRRLQAELDASEMSRIEHVLARRGFDGRGVVLAARPRSLTCAAITMPPASSGAPLDQIARAELARIARREPGAVEVGWWPVPAPAGGRQHEATHALATACSRAEVEALVANFDAAGLEVEAVDAPAWALARAARYLLAAEGVRHELSAILDLGHSLASLAVIRDGVPVYERTLEDLGVGALEQELRKSQGVSEELAAHIIERVGLDGHQDEGDEAPAEGTHCVGEYLARVAGEVSASIGYLAHRYPAWPVESVLCAGGGALIPGGCRRLAEETRLDVRACGLAGLSAAEADAGPDYLLAAGLALYEPEDRE